MRKECSMLYGGEAVYLSILQLMRLIAFSVEELIDGDPETADPDGDRRLLGPVGSLLRNSVRV